VLFGRQLVASGKERIIIEAAMPGDLGNTELIMQMLSQAASPREMAYRMPLFFQYTDPPSTCTCVYIYIYVYSVYTVCGVG
jgi:hypothetical protein